LLLEVMMMKMIWKKMRLYVLFFIILKISSIKMADIMIIMSLHFFWTYRQYNFNPELNTGNLYDINYIMIEWLYFNANSAIFQLYHDENKLIFNKMMMKSNNENILASIFVYSIINQ
jgi:hypothetical protein